MGKEKGIKFDQQKRLWNLLPWDEVYDVVRWYKKETRFSTDTLLESIIGYCNNDKTVDFPLEDRIDSLSYIIYCCLELMKMDSMKEGDIIPATFPVCNDQSWSLLPWKQLEGVVRVLEFGAQKYSIDNWKYVEPKTRYTDALLRHTIAYIRGEKNDPETGISHLAHAICCAFFTLWRDKQIFIISEE